jgi:hypothetical protein
MTVVSQIMKNKSKGTRSLPKTMESKATAANKAGSSGNGSFLATYSSTSPLLPCKGWMNVCVAYAHLVEHIQKELVFLDHTVL